MKALDTPYSVAGKAHQLQAMGYGAVIRYISPNTQSFPHKCLTTEEVRGLHSVGIKIGSVWESGFPIKASYFTAAQGAKDGMSAAATAKRLGQPQGSAIYFTVDYDATEADIEGPVHAYAVAFHDAVKGAGYLCGVYGSAMVIENLWRSGYAHYRWLAQSMGWSGSPNYHAADINQGPSTTVLGLDVDADTVTTSDAGLW
jgi:hypothetical protein